MAQKPREEWFWTGKREKAAMMLSLGRTGEDVAAAAGVSHRALTYWKTAPEFTARIKEHVAAQREAIRHKGIAIVENRVAVYQDTEDKVKQVIAERAVVYGKPEIPGGKTGLVVTEFKTIRVTDDKGNDVLKLVPEHVVDTGLMKERRENLKQAAQELGQWAEKQELTGKDGEPIAVQHDVTAALSKHLSALRAGRRSAGAQSGELVLREPSPGDSGASGSTAP